jgi:hypothetical protein
MTDPKPAEPPKKYRLCHICKREIAPFQPIAWKSMEPRKAGLHPMPQDAWDIRHVNCVLIAGLPNRADYRCWHDRPYVGKAVRPDGKSMALCFVCLEGAKKLQKKPEGGTDL